VAKGLDRHKTTVAHYDGSFFKLRHEIDHLMNGKRSRARTGAGGPREWYE